MAVSSIEEVVEDIKAGKMVILVDDEDRENEGDLCMAAELVTPEAINFMATYGRGLICLAMSPDILVLDEPTSNLDPRARRDLITLLKSFEHTKIIATHDLDMVMDLCGRTIVMHQGHVLADGPSTEIFTDDALLEAGRLERPLSMR